MGNWRVTDQDGDEDEYDSVTRLSYLSDIDSIQQLVDFIHRDNDWLEFMVIDDRTMILVWSHDFIEKYERLDD